MRRPHLGPICITQLCTVPLTSSWRHLPRQPDQATFPTLGNLSPTDPPALTRPLSQRWETGPSGIYDPQRTFSDSRNRCDFPTQDFVFPRSIAVRRSPTGTFPRSPCEISLYDRRNPDRDSEAPLSPLRPAPHLQPPAPGEQPGHRLALWPAPLALRHPQEQPKPGALS